MVRRRAAYAYLEFRLRRAAKRQKQTMRAFRVRDKITGKQKMVPMDEAELNEVMDGGKKKSKDDAGSETPRGLGGIGLPSRDGDSSAAKTNAGDSKKMPARVDEVKDEVWRCWRTSESRAGRRRRFRRRSRGTIRRSRRVPLFHSLVLVLFDSAAPAAHGDVPGQIGASPVVR